MYKKYTVVKLKNISFIITYILFIIMCCLYFFNYRQPNRIIDVILVVLLIIFSILMNFIEFFREDGIIYFSNGTLKIETNFFNKEIDLNNKNLRIEVNSYKGKDTYISFALKKGVNNFIIFNEDNYKVRIRFLIKNKVDFKELKSRFY